jgi:hypothetical protein
MIGVKAEIREGDNMKHKFEIGTRVVVIGDPEYAGRTGVISGHEEDDQCSCCPERTYFLNRVLFDDGNGYELFTNSDLRTEREKS